MAGENEVERIRALLMRHPRGLTIEEVSKELGINRSTASKYLNSLVFSGTVNIRKLGPAKLFSLSDQLPIHSLINITSDLILLFDNDFTILDTNEAMLDYFGLEPEEVRSVPLADTPLTFLLDGEMMEHIRKLRGGRIVSLVKELDLDDKSGNFEIRIMPVRFESGKSGYAIAMKEVPDTSHRDTPPSSDIPVRDTYKKTCSLAFQLNLLFRRYTQNQIAAVEANVRLLQKACRSIKSAELISDQETVLKNLKFHLDLLDEYLGDELRVPDWHLLEKVIIRTVPFQNLGHVRFFSDIKKVWVYSDATCARVFSSLVENSLVHGIRVTSIRITAKEQGQDLVIVYEDDGVGIPPADKGAVFEWGHKNRKGHSLFLTRQILAITDISIQETGTPGRGARFEIRIPPGCWKKE